MKKIGAIISFCSFFIFLYSCTPKKQPVELTVSAAISMKDALEEIKALYHQENQSVTIMYNFASSGTLQHQIEEGAPVDIYISAALKQLDVLEGKGLLINETRLNLLKNRLVLIVPKGRKDVTQMNDLLTERVSKITIGEPKSVPAGKYSYEMFTSLGMVEALQSKLVYANNVRQALSYVETGNVDAGVVYETDAKSSSDVSIVSRIEDSLHSPICYPAAVLKLTKNPDAAKTFLSFLSSASAKSIFEKYGFLPYTQ